MIREWGSHPRKMKKLYSKRSRIEAIFWSIKSRLGDIVKCRTPWTILIEFWCKVILYNALLVVKEVIRI
ncbi:MAG: transposase [Methanomicrobia archaeon]|nr:transposase [Methanomicrobia archaeon]